MSAQHGQLSHLVGLSQNKTGKRAEDEVQCKGPGFNFHLGGKKGSVMLPIFYFYVVSLSASQ